MTKAQGGTRADSLTASVVIPAYNCADVLERAIDSAVEQTIDDIEIIVVDDASEDGTVDVVTEYSDPRITLLRHDENRGGAAARNTGIREASGKYLAFLDADDKWHPPKLHKQISKLEARSYQWVASYTDYRTFGGENNRLLSRILALIPSGGKSLPKEGGEEVIPSVFLRVVQHGGATSLLAERAIVESIDGFDESFDRYQDIEFLIRLLKHGKVAYIDEELFTKEISRAPSASVGEAAQRKLFEKFSDEIEDLEAKGFDIIGNQRCILARMYLNEGNLSRGVKYIYGSSPRNNQEYFMFVYLTIRALVSSIIGRVRA